MTTNDFPMSVEEKELVLLWRSLIDAQILIHFRNGQPEKGKVYHPGFMYRRVATDRPLDQLEREVLKTGRIMGFGDLSIHVVNGSPLHVLNDSFQSIKFGYDGTK